MKIKPLSLLIGALIGTQVLLNGVGTGLPQLSHQDSLQWLLGISTAHAEESAEVKYTCPMHPQVISDTPGKCPICGMDLVPIAGLEHTHGMNAGQEETQATQNSSDRKVLYWYDPMRPEQHFDKPGKSPFMDMQLVPKYADATETESGGKPVVSISAATIQKMGVRTEKVGKSAFGGRVRATAIVMDNERARRDVFSQVEGRVEDLKVSAEGDRVKKGDAFYTLVSPDLVALQSDYLAALSGGLKDLAGAAAKRMELLGVEPQVVATVAKSREAYDNVPFYVPSDGVLSKLAIKSGAYVKTGDMIGQIQDLSTVWIEAAVPEGDLPAVRAGDSATVVFTGNPRPYDARVDYVYPTIDGEARTGKVRLVVDNKDGSLKPAGYATVEFAAAVAERLTVPPEAILRSSTGDHVIVARGKGKFQARDVQTGASSADKTEILSGLQEGEEVVTSAQFLIDSESSLKESLTKLSGGKE